MLLHIIAANVVIVTRGSSWMFQEHGENISGSELHAILSEIDTNNNGQVELEEYLQVKMKFQFVVHFFGPKYLTCVEANLNIRDVLRQSWCNI